MMQSPLLSGAEPCLGTHEPVRPNQKLALTHIIAGGFLLQLALLAWSALPASLSPSSAAVTAPVFLSVSEPGAGLEEKHVVDSLEKLDDSTAEELAEVTSPLHKDDLDIITLAKPSNLALLASKRSPLLHTRNNNVYRISQQPLSENSVNAKGARSASGRKVRVVTAADLRGELPSGRSEVTAQAAATASLDISQTASELDKMEDAAISMDPDCFKPKRGPDGRLEPVLTLPGDTLETTPLMHVITAASTVTMLGVVARAFVLSDNPMWPILSLVFGFLAGEMFSGTFHWATDNYGRLETPVVGFACAAFQGHHLAPWTISHRSFSNNVYKIAGASIPINLAGLLFFSPCGAAFLAVMTYCQLLAQEFHRWTHTPPKHLTGWKLQLQKMGIALPFAEHLSHHKPPFDKHYCILTGQLNELLDSKPLLFWRRLEALVYRINGVEPLSWKSPQVKQLALSTWPSAERLSPPPEGTN